MLGRAEPVQVGAPLCVVGLGICRQRCPPVPEHGGSLTCVWMPVRLEERGMGGAVLAPCSCAALPAGARLPVKKSVHT